MSSHSRAKGKARKSTASSAKSSASDVPQTSPSLSRERKLSPSKAREASDENETFTLDGDQIARITGVAMKVFADDHGTHAQSDKEHAARVDEALRGIHPSMSVEATRVEQAEQHLFSSMIVALQPFYSGK
jgi:hypothetical protein